MLQSSTYRDMLHAAKEEAPASSDPEDAVRSTLAMPPEEVYSYAKDTAMMLYEACIHLRDDHVQLLLEAGAPVTYMDPRHQYTALHMAALNGSAAQVAWLLDAGADATVKDCEGCMPLDHAKRECHALAELLLTAATPA